MHTTISRHVESPSAVYQDSNGDLWRLKISVDVEKTKLEADEIDFPLPLTKKLAEKFLANPERELHYYTSIETDSAEILAEHPGDLELNGLSKLSEGAAEALSKHKGLRLYLNGLSELTEGVAEALANHKGGLSLDGLSELSEGVAEALSKHKGSWISLAGLSELSEGVAVALSKHKGGYLYLDGLSELSENVANALSKHKGKICDRDPKDWSVEFKAR